MNKAELITTIASHAQLTKADAYRALEGLVTASESNLKTAILMRLWLLCFVYGRLSRTNRNECCMSQLA